MRQALPIALLALSLGCQSDGRPRASSSNAEGAHRTIAASRPLQQIPPLIEAILHRSPAALELIAAGADVNVSFGRDTALCTAARYGTLPVVKAMVERGADLQG